MRKKNFDYAKDKYYFNIKTSAQSAITINRTDKREAMLTFMGYQKAKKNVEWLGKWDGKKFTEDNFEKIKQN